VGGTTKDVTTRAMIGGFVVVVGASAAAWALTNPQGAPAATVVRALADCAGAATLGLAVVPMLDTVRYREQLTLGLAVHSGGRPVSGCSPNCVASRWAPPRPRPFR
jgi:hypothetical protein